MNVPECPWRILSCPDANMILITNPKGWVVALQINGEMMPALQEETARRIVACVNACDGIRTEYLEKFGGTTFNDFKRVKFQRDEMMSTLEQIARGEYSEGEEVGMAKAAIEKATEHPTTGEQE